MDTKVCSKCKIEKPKSEFHKRNTGGSKCGVFSSCKNCVSDFMKSKYTKTRLPEVIIPIEGEIWKDIVGYEGRYVVSSNGRVKATYDALAYDGHRILKPAISKGYKRVTLCLPNSNERAFSVHFLVAQAFIANPENKFTVNHKNFIKGDNRVENLEWFTQQEQVQHAIKAGVNKCRGETNGSAKLTNEKVKEIFYGKLSSRKTAKLYGVTKGIVLKIRDRTIWKHLTAHL